MNGIFLLCRVDKDLKVKVADFGFSRDIYSRDYYRLERKTRLPVKWLPPECLLDNKYDVKTDVVSYTVHCYRGGTITSLVVLWNCVLGDIQSGQGPISRTRQCRHSRVYYSWQ